jgi:hypothetical protein
MNDGSEIIIMILVRLVFGAACAAIAHSKGRSPVGWFFGGFFIACLGLIILLCLSNEKEKLEAARVQDDVNRRLREQLRQEQMKIEALRAHTAARLDAHDEALGLNTRAAAPALMSAAPPMARLSGGSPSPKVTARASVDDGTEWYYLDRDSQQQGPMSIIALRSGIVTGKVTPATLVWHEGLADWTPAHGMPKLSLFFATS